MLSVKFGLETKSIREKSFTETLLIIVSIVAQRSKAIYITNPKSTYACA